MNNVLILMPIDEQHAVDSLKLAEEIDKNGNCVCDLPSYADWLVKVGKADCWEKAVVMALIALSNFNTQLVPNNKVNVIIGNSWKEGEYAVPFDLIVNFDNDEVEKPYEDKFLDIVKKHCEGIKEFEPYFTAMYDNSDSKLSMKNIKATGKFINDMVKIPIRENREEYDRIYAEYEEWKRRNFIR